MLVHTAPIKRLHLVFLAAILVCSNSCGGRGDPTRDVISSGANDISDRATTSDLPDIVLMVIDTLRPDHMSGYGYPRTTTPNLDRIMAEGARFDHAMSTSSWSASAQTSIITGANPYSHHVMSWGHSIEDSIEPLAVHLKARGYATGLFSTHIALHESVGRIKNGLDHLVVLENDQDAEALRQATEWAGRTKSPKFLYICLMTPHAPYVNYPEEYDSLFVDEPPVGKAAAAKTFPFLNHRWIGPGGIPQSVRLGDHQDVGYYINRYDRGVYYADEMAGRFFADLARQGSDHDLLTVITSDHGEGLGDHGIFAHEVYLYDFLVRVPLLVRYPARIAKGQSFRQQISVADIVPTILGLIGSPQPELDGENLSSALMREEPELDGDRLLTASYRSRGYDRYMVRSNTHKLLLDTVSGKEELYDLVADPQENQDLLDSGSAPPAELEVLRVRMSDLLESHTSLPADRVSVPLEDHVIEELKALGYLVDD